MSAADFRQDATGLVSIEAEHYSTNTAQGGREWTNYTSGPSGASGGMAVRATPDTDTGGASNNGVYSASLALTQSPHLDYTVDFNRTGTHYVWVRGYGANSYDDSVHVAIDGAIPTTADDINIANTGAWV